MEGNGRLAVARVDVGEHLVRLSLLLLIVILNAKLEELLQVLNGVVVIVRAHLLLNERDLLVTLRLFVLVVRALSHVETLFEEGKTQVEFVAVLVLDSDQLVDAHEVA